MQSHVTKGRVRELVNKSELVERVASSASISKKEASEVVDALFSTIEEALAQGEKVQIIGFGSFEVRDRAARTGRDPQTGREIQIEARRVPVFKAGKTLKEAVQKEAAQV